MKRLAKILVDRLAAWQLWSSERDAVNAFLIWRANVLNEKRLRALAKSREVGVALDSLIGFRTALAGADPSVEQLTRWARRTA